MKPRNDVLGDCTLLAAAYRLLGSLDGACGVVHTSLQDILAVWFTLDTASGHPGHCCREALGSQKSVAWLAQTRLQKVSS